MTVTRAQWCSAFGLAAGPKTISFTKTNQLALCAWMAGERAPDIAEGGALWNPLNSTLKTPGSTEYNKVGVQNYPSLEVGIHATLAVLMQPTLGDYGPIRAWLASGSCMCETLYAVTDSGWGTFHHPDGTPWSKEEVDGFVNGVLAAPAPYLGAPIPGS